MVDQYEKGQKVRIKLKAFDHKLLDQSATEIVGTVHRTGGRLAGPIPLPTKIERYTVLRSPHGIALSRPSVHNGGPPCGAPASVRRTAERLPVLSFTTVSFTNSPPPPSQGATSKFPAYSFCPILLWAQGPLPAVPSPDRSETHPR